MNCPHCGEVCFCHLEPPPAAPAEPAPENGDRAAFSLPPATTAVETGPAEPTEDDSAWRDELALRLNRYRSRRKIRPPRYPSLRLQFDVPPVTRSVERPGSNTPYVYELEPVSDRALALDQTIVKPDENEMRPDPGLQSAPAAPAAPNLNSGAKIIEFPRFAWGPPPPPSDQLAEPVIDRPRILEVPEVAPPPPALGGITIEPSQVQEEQKRPGIDYPLQSASFARRVTAAGADGLIIAGASGLFAFIFWKVAGIHPPGPQLLGLALGIPALFWAAYQFLLVVYAGRTPGLMAAGLELTRFDGTAASRPLRRWRVLASYLSAASLGMGYVWVFLDEDALCWHDRITHTYLSPREPVSSS